MAGKQTPRELSNQFGYESLTKEQLIALILRFGSKKISVFELAKYITQVLETGLARGVSTAAIKQQIIQLQGITKPLVHVILSFYELLLRQKTQNYPILLYKKPVHFADHFHFLVQKRQEYVYGVYLSPRLALVRKELLAKGTTDAVLIDVRDMLYFGIKHRVRHVALVHNHPTGDPTPSPEDISQTKKAKDAAQLLGMFLLDHIIVAKRGYYSFKESTNML